MRALALVAALSACTIPDKHPTATGDAQVFNDAPADADPALACAGQAFPTTTSATMLTFDGHIVDGFPPSSPPPAVAGAQVQLLLSASQTQYATSVADSNGAYGMTFPTNGNAIDGYLTITSTPVMPYLPAYYYPSRPYDADMLTNDMQSTTQAEMQSFYTANTLTWDPMSVFVLVYAVDCNGKPLAGVHFTITPPAGITPSPVFYSTAQGFDASKTVTDASGAALLVNEPASLTTFQGTFGSGTPMHAYDIKLVGGSWTVVVMQP